MLSRIGQSLNKLLKGNKTTLPTSHQHTFTPHLVQTWHEDSEIFPRKAFYCTVCKRWIKVDPAHAHELLEDWLVDLAGLKDLSSCPHR